MRMLWIPFEILLRAHDSHQIPRTVKTDRSIGFYFFTFSVRGQPFVTSFLRSLILYLCPLFCACRSTTLILRKN